MDKRVSERFDAHGIVLLHAGRESSHDALSNLSVSGCRLSGIDQEIEVGTDVQLTLIPGIDVSGTVRWIEGGDVGIEFDDRLPDAAVKYFTFRETGGRDAITTQDGFGRRLPPLSQANLPEHPSR